MALKKQRIFIIGKSRDCDVVLADDTVSRVHAELLAMSDGIFFLTDMSSTNGTFLLKENTFVKIRQNSVTPIDILRFGNCQMKMKDILEYLHLKLTPLLENPKIDGPNLRAKAKIVVRCVHCGSPKQEDNLCEICGMETRRY